MAHASSQAIVAEVARRTELKGGGKNIASLLAQLRELLCSAVRDAPDGPASVSYTHLTLPTILLV